MTWLVRSTDTTQEPVSYLCADETFLHGLAGNMVKSKGNARRNIL